MKIIKMLIASGVMLMCSCASPRYTVFTSTLDYSVYGGDDFFITESNSVSFDYVPKGSISTIVLSGKMGGYGPWIEANPQRGIKDMVENAKKNGANGIINFQIKPYEATLSGKQRYGLLLTGMTIKK